jgi:hypothetical protein
LIGVEYARFLPLQGGQLALQPGAFVLGPDIDRRIPAPLLILLSSHFRVGQQRLHVLACE